MTKREMPWKDIYEAWRSGADIEGLASQHGLSAGYLRRKLNAAHEVLGGAETSIIDPRLEPALSALARGDAAEAERLAKAVSAVVRAGEALESQRRRERTETDVMSEAELEPVLEGIEDYVQARVRSETAAGAAAHAG